MTAHIIHVLSAIQTPLWTLLGVIVGATVSSYLTARLHHKQWVMDNKKAEYRELLDALHAYYRAVLWSRWSGGHVQQSGPTEADTMALMWSALSNRLFVRVALVEGGIHRDFQKLTRSLRSENPPNKEDWAKAWYSLHRKLLRVAWKDTKIPKEFRPIEPAVDQSQRELDD